MVAQAPQPIGVSPAPVGTPCTCEPYKPCAACEAIQFDPCEVCEEPRSQWHRCEHCGAMDIGYLHSKVRGDWTVRVEIDADGKGGRLAA